jgi:hypothetical protein
MANAIIATNELITAPGLDFSDSSTAIADYPETNLQIYLPGESYRTATIEYAAVGVGTSATRAPNTIDLLGALYTNVTRHPNMLAQSNDLDEADWTATNVTPTEDTVNSSAPGVASSFELDDGVSAGEHSLFQDLAAGTTMPTQIGSAFVTGYASQYFTASWYVAQGAAGDLDVRLRIESDTTHYMECSFDLSAGTAGTPAEDGSGEWAAGVATIAAADATIGNKTWYRITLTARYDGAADSSLGSRLMLENTGSVSYTGSNETIFAQGAQLENAASASSFVETTTDLAAFAAYRDFTTHLVGFTPVATTDLRDLPFLHIFNWFSSPVAVSRPNVEIWDSGNADAYIEVGNLLVAQTLQPAVNAAIGWEVGYEEDADSTVALGGQLYRSVSPRRRFIRISHEWMTEVEAMEGALEIDRKVGASEGIFMAVDPTSTYKHKWSVFGVQDSIEPQVHKRYLPSTGSNSYSKSWRIVEALP